MDGWAEPTPHQIASHAMPPAPANRAQPASPTTVAMSTHALQNHRECSAPARHVRRRGTASSESAATGSASNDKGSGPGVIGRPPATLDHGAHRDVDARPPHL